jgi:colanic acid biosynthesis protein WcaH
MTIFEAVEFLDKEIPDKTKGLPEDVYFFLSRTTPLVNVDLLIKDKTSRTLLSWRDDGISEQGWHVPGSVVRFKETFEQCVQRCALQEIGTEVKFKPEPIHIRQMIVSEWKNLAHHVSFVYKCYLPESFVINNKDKKQTDPGFLAWHDKLPSNMIKVHEFYRRFIDL